MTEFQATRRAFIVFCGSIIVQPDDNHECTKDWMTQTLCMSEQQYNGIIRGYMMEDRIVFFGYGDEYLPVEVPVDIIDRAVSAHLSIYHNPAPHIYNGVRKGIEGDVWTPIFQYVNHDWKCVKLC